MWLLFGFVGMCALLASVVLFIIALIQKKTKKISLIALAVGIVLCIISSATMPKANRDAAEQKMAAENVKAASTSENNESKSSSKAAPDAAATAPDYSEKEIEKRIQDVEKYWSKQVMSELPKLTDKKDKDGTVALMSEITAKFDEEINYFMQASQTDGIADELKQACLDMKTGLYGANSTALKPMLAVFKEESTNIVDNYQDLISAADDYIQKAKQAI